MKKVYDYALRVSEVGDRDEDETFTIPEQQERCRRYITETLKGRVGKELSAVDVSGSVVIDHPAYQEALARVQAGTTAGFVVAYSSRFARNNWAVGRFLEALKRDDGELWFVDRPDVDYRTQAGAIIVSVDAVMNDNYLQECKTKAESTLVKNILERGVPNQYPFGYLRNASAPAPDPNRHPKALVPDPETAPIVRRIFEMRAEGRSWVTISERVGMTVPTVRSITRNEAYLGVVQYKRRTYRRGTRTGVVTRRDGCHEPLVKRALWLAAQSATTVQHTGDYAAGVAGDLLHCSTCGGKLSVGGSKTNLVYGCRRQRNHGRCAHPVHITKRIADAFVDEWMMRELRGRVGTTPGSDLGMLRAARDAARDELDAFAEHAEAMDREVFTRNLARRQEKLSTAEAALDAEEAKEGRMVRELPAPDVYASATTSDQRRIARALIDRIVVGPRAGGSPRDRLSLIER